MTRDDLKCDGLSDFDLDNLTRIIREDFGTWYHDPTLAAVAT